jgi:hypothetical protein
MDRIAENSDVIQSVPRFKIQNNILLKDVNNS